MKFDWMVAQTYSKWMVWVSTGFRTTSIGRMVGSARSRCWNWTTSTPPGGSWFQPDWRFRVESTLIQSTSEWRQWHRRHKSTIVSTITWWYWNWNKVTYARTSDDTRAGISICSLNLECSFRPSAWQKSTLCECIKYSNCRNFSLISQCLLMKHTNIPNTTVFGPTNFIGTTIASTITPGWQFMHWMKIGWRFLRWP